MAAVACCTSPGFWSSAAPWAKVPRVLPNKLNRKLAGLANSRTDCIPKHRKNLRCPECLFCFLRAPACNSLGLSGLCRS